MLCIFFGPKDTRDTILPSLEKAIFHLIQSEGVRDFYIGNNGNFDGYAQRLLREISKTENIQYTIVLSRLNEQALNGDQNATLFPLGQENIPPRFAISKRNEWLIQHASHAIVYVKYKISNSFRWAEKCVRKGIKTIHLQD